MTLLLVLTAIVLLALAGRLGVDLVITAANVKPGTGFQKVTGVAGEAITAGQSVFLDNVTGSTTNGKYLKSDANDGTRNKFDGIAMNSPGSGQALVVANGGEIDIGATLTTGEIYVVSATPGGVAPVGDKVTGWRVIIAGYALAAARFKINKLDTTATV
jgi:hypothetical protein